MDDNYVDPCDIGAREDLRDMGDEHAYDACSNDSSGREGNQASGRDSLPLLSLNDLRHLRSSIRKIHLPTWMPRPPLNLGEASRGKLKASSWKCLHLSVFLSLAMLQIGCSKPDFARKWAYLAATVVIVAMRETVPERIQLFVQSMHAYYTQSNQLAPAMTVTPMLHSSFHIEHQLSRLAPAACLSTWRPEQLNGLLQRMPHNPKLCAYKAKSRVGRLQASG